MQTVNDLLCGTVRFLELSSTGIGKLYGREDSVMQDDSVFLLTEVKTDASVNKVNFTIRK